MVSCKLAALLLVAGLLLFGCCCAMGGGEFEDEEYWADYDEQAGAAPAAEGEGPPGVSGPAAG